MRSPVLAIRMVMTASGPRTHGGASSLVQMSIESRPSSNSSCGRYELNLTVTGLFRPIIDDPPRLDHTVNIGQRCPNTENQNNLNETPRYTRYMHTDSFDSLSKGPMCLYGYPDVAKRQSCVTPTCICQHLSGSGSSLGTLWYDQVRGMISLRRGGRQQFPSTTTPLKDERMDVVVTKTSYR